jgi:hypothetical protein
VCTLSQWKFRNLVRCDISIFKFLSNKNDFSRKRSEKMASISIMQKCLFGKCLSGDVILLRIFESNQCWCCCKSIVGVRDIEDNPS